MSDLKQIDEVDGVTIYSIAGTPASILFKAGMAIDADGAPDCYGPDDSGLDWTENGGTPGENWWGGPTDDKGMPIVQKIYDPCPGMYVSATAHSNPAYDERSPYRYLDSSSIPFFVLPGKHNNGANLGDVGLLYNTETGDNCYGVYGDVGPSSKIGEASCRMAEALGIDADPKEGGIGYHRIVYLVFPGSIGKWMPPSVWFDVANSLTKSWGGLSRLQQLIKEL